MVPLHIDKKLEAFQPEVSYILKLWSQNQSIDFEISGEPENAFQLGDNDQLNSTTISNLLTRKNHPTFNADGIIMNANGKPDYLSTAFYMVNSLQEFDDNDPDTLGRFKFTNSYQFKLKKSKENIVQHCFNELTKMVGLTVKEEKTRFFLTHDIDMVNGAILEDGFNVLKKGRIDKFLQMLLHVALAKPDWLNMDKIMKLESESDCKSVFFWIVNKGNVNQRESNADYSFRSKKIQKEFHSIERSGFENGIHKSISSETFQEEFKKYGKQPISNRYHYLKFHLPYAYHDIENAALKLDASLGFAEEIGFRNSYGLPFTPFNFKSRKSFSFVEVPLHVMDRTYFQYKKYPVDEAEKDIFDFFDKNKSNCVISILWHNNFFTDYKFKGYLALYKKILAYLKENNVMTITQGEIVKKYATQ